MSTNAAFRPHIRVHHRYYRPTPILPVNYGWFLFVALPTDIVLLPLAAQLIAVKSAIFSRRSYPFEGPFGALVAFELRRTESYSIYLNKEADFAQDNEEQEETN